MSEKGLGDNTLTTEEGILELEKIKFGFSDLVMADNLLQRD